MRLVDALFRRFRRIRREDPVFGSMLYMGDRLKYWEGKAKFGPTNSVIEIFVDGSAQDSLGEQRKFFEHVVQEWVGLSEVIGRILLESSRKHEPILQDDSPWDHFKASSLSIPQGPFEDAEWEFSFATPGKTNRLWTVRMKGRQARQVVVDD